MSFSNEDLDILQEHVHRVELQKGELLLTAEETVNYQYYVQSGCLRTYFIDQSGKEFTLQFAIHDWWISDYTAFFSASKSLMHIECLQDAELYRISKSSMEQLFLEIPRLESFFRRKMERAFASFQKRILAGLSLPAKERYLAFIKAYPNIEQSVKNYHIASYLGITTESLSRIRKEVSTF
ncbi:Crp/Fnr family transcriptional regulator [Zunongwangia sp. HGR-M22]|uniref:Crp/Fnr family transcriptional regulator n=1 Tax=Zunongwangia sp. HGR-M22 TaxID=3015168 RepID=UPI0022DCF33E|nr:Crp/Fnr family transcriptional regulator [Zunongwangia sp. HGR-M22]WBL25066.1 Crp/Fnr family transcriptional regulator [Zunongwangia sp. HGR-M22]